MMPDHTTTAEQRVPWGEVAVFFAIAAAVSAPFRLGWFDPASYVTLPFGLNLLFKVLRGIGPAVGFVVMRYVVHSHVPRTTSFWGINSIASTIAILVFPIGLTIIGVENNAGLSPAVYGFLGGMTFVLYAIGEEYGWRGYLQQALSPLKLPVRIIAIATIWYLWHLNFLNPNISLTSHLTQFAALVLGSWGLLKVTESTHSILFAAAIHLIFNLFADAQINGTKRMVFICVAAVVWTGLIILIERKKMVTAPSQPAS
jgi:membrane protease YdiL (CAAX protease family)